MFCLVLLVLFLIALYLASGDVFYYDRKKTTKKPPLCNHETFNLMKPKKKARPKTRTIKRIRLRLFKRAQVPSQGTYFDL